MIKENFASINVIIDRSGSMGNLATDTIGGFNTFVAEQKLTPGEAAFTLCTFSTDYSLVHDFVKLGSVPDLDAKSYRPSGGTALLDALGTTINSVGQKLAAMPEDERPSSVLFLIITDGQENSSHTFTKAQVKAMIEHQRETYKWEFVFMGANIDAISEGTSLGISASNSMNYSATKGGTRDLYRSVSSNTSSYRSSGSQQVDFFNQTVAAPVTPAVAPTVITPVVTVTPGTKVTP